ncbi:MAG: hypothetical protein HYR61_12860 [Acidobacteria bacterium]|nr:hypothetical protein [Acidobacteriota bacterium]
MTRSQHLPGEVRGLLHRHFRLFQRPSGRSALIDLGLSEVQVAQHRGQKVVEVVGDAAREHAKAFQALRVQQGLLGAALLLFALGQSQARAAQFVAQLGHFAGGGAELGPVVQISAADVAGSLHQLPDGRGDHARPHGAGGQQGQGAGDQEQEHVPAVGPQAFAEHLGLRPADLDVQVGPGLAGGPDLPESE